MTQTKVCTKCGEEKGLGGFHKNKNGKFGVTPICKVCQSEYHKQYRQENRERLREYNKQYHKENRQKRQQYFRENRKKRISIKAKRRARKLNATPNWLTPIDYLVMQHIYKTRPDGHHVDHIVPLRGKTVCGLHVPWNLQHLPIEENLSKGNTVWPDMWEEV